MQELATHTEALAGAPQELAGSSWGWEDIDYFTLRFVMRQDGRALPILVWKALCGVIVTGSEERNHLGASLNAIAQEVTGCMPRPCEMHEQPIPACRHIGYVEGSFNLIQCCLPVRTIIVIISSIELICLRAIEMCCDRTPGKVLWCLVCLARNDPHIPSEGDHGAQAPVCLGLEDLSGGHGPTRHPTRHSPY